MTGGPIVASGWSLLTRSSSSFECDFGHFAPSPCVLHCSNCSTDTLFLRINSTSAALYWSVPLDEAVEMVDELEPWRC